MSRARPDLSSKLVHLMKGNTVRDAFTNLESILKTKDLKGGTGMIKGAHTCVCFTESPLAQLALSLSDRDHNKFKYRPMGIMVDKSWAFKQGARPVIYQPEDEYDLLPDALKYRHVTYDPVSQVDFTWEREWRLYANVLKLAPEKCALVLPKREWADELIEEHFSAVRNEVGTKGGAAVTRYPWHIVVLEDLGIAIPDGL